MGWWPCHPKGRKKSCSLGVDRLMTSLRSLCVLALQIKPHIEFSIFVLIGICGLLLPIAASQRAWLKCQDIFFQVHKIPKIRAVWESEF